MMKLVENPGYRIRDSSMIEDLWLRDDGVLILARTGIKVGALQPPTGLNWVLITAWSTAYASGKLLRLPDGFSALQVGRGELRETADLLVIRPDGFQEIRRVEIWEGLEVMQGEGPKSVWDRLA